ncbi:MAG: SDR family NAD(P)-dependent oxidoreductase [Desulfatitalea sp.]|nr:SDR family NAD(P)-dependent oxidoreductase [Desulfatitalea sp.]NNJ99066.1 SDR family NAD(P)-dependent oxidoreductase [Desulfatitalea sp.]
MELCQCKAIVTGGASGLGEATARTLVAQGARVAIFDMDPKRGETLSAELGDSTLFCQVDVSDEQRVDDAAAMVRETFGAINLVINCAGTGRSARIVDREGNVLPLKYFKDVVEVNLIGTYNMIRGTVSSLLANTPNAEGEKGVYINVASIAAQDGQVGQAGYSASKGGIVSLGLTLAREFADDGIRFMTIMPGIMGTPMMAKMPDKVIERLEKQVPFPSRLGKPEEFAKLACSIIENPYLNGENIRMDGAMRMGFGRK